MIVVAAVAALAVAGLLVGVAHMARSQRRHFIGESVRDLAEEDALRLRRHASLADEYAARADAAEVEIDIKTIRACRPQQQATTYRSKAATSRDQPQWNHVENPKPPATKDLS